MKALSHNRMAERVARSLFERAREGSRHSADVPAAFHEQTSVAIAAGSADEAASTMPGTSGTPGRAGGRPAIEARGAPGGAACERPCFRRVRLAHTSYV